MPENSKTTQPLKFCQNDGLYIELIRRRAYELYLERGMTEGHDVEDWLRAEEEVLPDNKKPVAVAA